MQPLGVDEPTAVGPYRLLGRLGSGGMGRVYLGRSAGGRTVAVKIVHPHFALDEEFRARFRREVDAARRVGGAWTAPVLDADPEAAVPWVATGYAAGPSLASAVTDGGPLPEHSVRVLGAGLAEALAAVHGLGLVHRDVKPSNVLLTVDGPLLIDFGIARATDGTASLTSTGVSIGSPGYMSPEQILSKGVSGAADVFSLGAVLAYAATGVPPFPGDSSASLLYKVVHEEPELGSLTGELRDLVGACLSKSAQDRPTPEELARRLAPEGAARLVVAGWLPGALVEQVGRSAVQLLNLEAAGEQASGPVGFSSPSVGGGSAGTVGAFGPPPVMPAVSAGAPPAAAAGPPAFPVTPPATTGGPLVPEPRDAVPHETVVPSDKRPGPGRLSVSVAATATPGESGRGRRMSCTVALAVAGALAAVTVGSVFLFDLLPGRGEDDSASSGPGNDAYSSAPSSVPSASLPSASSAPSASSTPSSQAPSGPSAVPARYLGTWEGQGSGLGGSLPMGTFRITVKNVGVGEELGRLRQTDAIGAECTDVLTLKQVTETELVTTAVGAKDNHAGCNPTAHTVRLTAEGDDLKYTSESEAEGYPEARMSKVER
ncbi:serine/threonine protein kinase [Streptomyces canus]|uniref:Serine/threonine protein kinase n=1 Tax=Streptomyces canus TaxID=58343 RepID=A0A117R682_9ACTN|nr:MULTISPECIES: serine/threonine-protein kinase [Streptomyces]KUN73318.1 serine/threonine protein kinase [Streptomyces canus]MDI5903463.1 serine/threonine-protein kinase [Streptomyces sp. 12257]